MARTRNSGRVSKRLALARISNKQAIVQKQTTLKTPKTKLIAKPATLTYKNLVIDALKDLNKHSSVKAIQNRIHQFYPKMDLKDHLIRKTVMKLFQKGDLKNSTEHKLKFGLKPVPVVSTGRNTNRAANRRLATQAARSSTGLFGGPVVGGVLGGGLFGSVPPPFGQNLPSGVANSITSTPAPASVTNSTIIPGAAVPSNCTIHQPYDIHLNLTNHARNMDKFMKMQIVKDAANYYFINCWGKNGTSGQNQVKTFGNQVDAEKAMEQKFKQKTGKTWQNRNNATSSNADARSGHGHYEIVQRLKAAGAGFSTKKGSVAISLMWDHSKADVRNDLDLWVTAPSGERIGYSHKRSACGGELDVDRMQGAPQPVENIVWLGKAPVGKYKVQVHNYSLNHNKSVKFQVSIVMNGGNREMFDLTMPGTAKSWVDVKEFEFK